ncbi:MAG: hypothetical protein ACQESV_09620 [Thermodesulfobacteriota bacterium]
MAGGKILSVSYIDGVYYYLEAEKKASGYFPQYPQSTTSLDAIKTLCRKADEIHLASVFPSAIYQRTLLPKVAKRYMPNLVNQQAKEKMGVSAPVLSRYKIIQEMTEAGVNKWQTGYCAIAESEVMALWEAMAPFQKKIRFVTPVSVAMAAMVSELEQPAEKFVVVWVGEQSSIIVIASTDGIVHVARNVPLRLEKRALQLQQPSSPAAHAPAGGDEDEIEVDMQRLMDQGAADEDGESTAGEAAPSARPSAGEEQHADMVAAGHFSRELEQELGRTFTFFKQEFREAAPSQVYLLGNPNLHQISRYYPLSEAYERVHYTLHTDSQRGLSSEFAQENIHLLGNLFVTDTFSFIPEFVAIKRKSNMLLNAAGVLLVAGIGAGVVWVDQLYQQRARAVQTHQERVDQIAATQEQAAELQDKVNRLKPIEGWKQFYDQTMAAKPPWDMFISELAMVLEDYVVIDSLKVLDGSGESRKCRVQGKIQAPNWETGLDLFRDFGRKVQASSLFDVTEVNYSPEGVRTDPSQFDFEMDVQLKRTGGA